MAKDLSFPKDKYFVDSDEIQKAEYSPWGRIFMRIEFICDRITEFSVEARSKNIIFIEPFFNSLRELYDHVSPLLIRPVIEKYDPKFVDLDRRITIWKRQMTVTGMRLFPADLINDLETLKRDLFELKQQVGLGVPVEKVVSIRKKLERVLGSG